jgi:predicted NBD/HSP70 family sugar kinase
MLSAMRQFNERAVLQAIRLNGSLSQARIARVTGLKPQTVSLILARLDRDDLLVRHASVRGRVGQPSVPISLNPEGAYAMGIEIGRRNMDALLVDFTGVVRKRLAVKYAFPHPSRLLSQIDRFLKALRMSLRPALRSRLCGIGIAAPLSLGGWQNLLGFAPELAVKWQSIELRDRVSKLRSARNLSTTIVKDTAAACLAELVSGNGRHGGSYLYIFIDTFIGGGLVLNGRLYGGVNGNAGAVGSVALGLATGNSRPGQLLSVASLWNLEAHYAKAGLDLSAWADSRSLSKPWARCTHRWAQRAARAIALAIHDAACLLEIESVVIDGSFSRQLLALLVDKVTDAADGYNWEGAARPQVLGGAIGPDARALGAAMLPLYAHFAPDRDLFLNAGAPS